MGGYYAIEPAIMGHRLCADIDTGLYPYLSK